MAVVAVKEGVVRRGATVEMGGRGAKVDMVPFFRPGPTEGMVARAAPGEQVAQGARAVMAVLVEMERTLSSRWGPMPRARPISICQRMGGMAAQVVRAATVGWVEEGAEVAKQDVVAAVGNFAVAAGAVATERRGTMRWLVSPERHQAHLETTGHPATSLKL